MNIDRHQLIKDLEARAERYEKEAMRVSDTSLSRQYSLVAIALRRVVDRINYSE